MFRFASKARYATRTISRVNNVKTRKYTQDVVRGSVNKHGYVSHFGVQMGSLAAVVAAGTYLVCNYGRAPWEDTEDERPGRRPELYNNGPDMVSLDAKPQLPVKANSLMSKNLTDEVWEECKDRKSSSGAGFDVVINSGVQNVDSGVGVYAPDADSYKTFAPLFDKVIEQYHNGYSKDDTHKTDLNVNNLVGDNPDPTGKYVVSTRIRVGRNLADYPLNPGINKEERREVESQVVSALDTLSGDLSGKYFPLNGMTEETRQKLVADHFLFKRGDRFLEAGNCNRDWPDARGIYHSSDKKFLVWVNEEDQLRIISMQKGSDIREVFGRLTRAVKSIEDRIKFSRNEHLGYISSCPTNLGTAMRASVHIRIPLASQQPNFKRFCEENGLSVRGIHGEHSKSEGGIYDISNKHRLGLSEVQCVQTMMDGVRKLIAWEQSLESSL
mmetsp:Transcript_7226/g.10633  ORF Transcript_7226/g.10633 Transcript_7226/m.10633 type:complete len:441 (-) Transcript_7226:332-1654(-)